MIDTKTFWRGLGQRAVGATIVTAADENGSAGFLGLSATHLCAHPPTMMVSIDLRTSALATILSARHFALNYLPEGSSDLANIFGGKTERRGSERFDPEKWTILKTGAPVFVDAIGVIDCELEETLERHGTVIAIGSAVALEVRLGSRPLICFGGSYLQ